MSVSLLFSLLPYWHYTNTGISQVLDKISFWFFLEIFLGWWYTCYKWFLFFCMSVSLIVGLLSYWNYTTIGISPVLDKISFLNFWRHAWDVRTLVPNIQIFLYVISVVVGILPYWNPEIPFLNLYGTHSWDVGTLDSNKAEFLVYLSVH